MILPTLRDERRDARDPFSPARPEPEREIINHVLRIAIDSGFHVDPVSITNLYVGLKSKPLTLLVGPVDTGKIAAVQTLAKGLMGEDPLRCQMMTGHSWWANQSSDVVRFTVAQACWNSGKIIDLIQEASLPENAQRMYLACLTRISPAEVNEFFSEVAYQLRHNQVMRIASNHLSEPIPFPRNMFLVGTMDASQFRWLDEDLLSKTSLLHWAPGHRTLFDQTSGNETIIDGERTFLRSCLRNAQAAFQRLYAILKSQRQAFVPLFETARVLRKHKIPMPDSALHSAMIYLANSWSSGGTGLFSHNKLTNLAIALDHAIAQTYLLPVQDRLMNTRAIQKNLRSVFKDRFPYSYTLLGMME